MKIKIQPLLLTFFIVCGYTSSLFSQSITADKVPAAVTESFKTKFPKAEQAKWVKSAEAEYSVFFSVNKWKHFAMFKSSGTCFEDDAEMAYSELPAPVKEVISKKYAGYKAEKSSLLIEEGRKNIYELFIVKEKESYNIQFSSEGNILKNSGKRMLK